MCVCICVAVANLHRYVESTENEEEQNTKRHLYNRVNPWPLPQCVCLGGGICSDITSSDKAVCGGVHVSASADKCV